MGKILLENMSDTKNRETLEKGKTDLVRSIVGSVKFYYQTWLDEWVEWSIRKMEVLVVSKNQDSAQSVQPC